MTDRITAFTPTALKRDISLLTGVLVHRERKGTCLTLNARRLEMAIASHQRALDELYASRKVTDEQYAWKTNAEGVAAFLRSLMASGSEYIFVAPSTTGGECAYVYYYPQLCVVPPWASSSFGTPGDPWFPQAIASYAPVLMSGDSSRHLHEGSGK
jgi:hypothetical protein